MYVGYIVIVNLVRADIGPQGIVHGTTLTLLNAGRKYLGSADLKGKLFVTSGLGGMSGAQAKAAVICDAITVVAEINPAAVKKRHDQHWVMEAYESLDQIIDRIKTARKVCCTICAVIINVVGGQTSEHSIPRKCGGFMGTSCEGNGYPSGIGVRSDITS